MAPFGLERDVSVAARRALDGREMDPANRTDISTVAPRRSETVLVILDLVLAATSDGALRTVILFCLLTIVVAALVTAAMKIEAFRDALERLLLRLAPGKRHGSYTICEELVTDEGDERGDGTASANSEFHFFVPKPRS